LYRKRKEKYNYPGFLGQSQYPPANEQAQEALMMQQLIHTLFKKLLPRSKQNFWSGSIALLFHK
jgi:hypothetical protein